MLAVTPKMMQKTPKSGTIILESEISSSYLFEGYEL
jgi:hypothetical protein